ncbi:hypothetical protein ACFW91_30150 [Streptomyces asoensis]|uniref:hypothetical protein n=1 Tax=Streptomyces asoensis TaxID=249586 RepID=UPI00367494D7
MQSVVRRHKTLGAWVPRWVAGPCHNTECEAYAEPAPHHEMAGAETEEEPGTPAAPASS